MRSEGRSATKCQLLLSLVLLLIICFTVSPVFNLPNRSLMPDFLYCAIAAWTIRRPECVPLPIVVLALLISEILLLRTPGLWSAILVLAIESIRIRGPHLWNLSFLHEWMVVVAAYGCAVVVHQFAHTLAFLPAASPKSLLQGFLATAVAYPAIVLMANWPFRIAKPAAAERAMFVDARQ